MEKEKRMREIVNTYYKSEKGGKEFASINGLTLRQLNYWVDKLNKEKQLSSSFVQVNPSGISPINDLLEISYPNGVKIKVPTGNLAFLSELIKVY